MTALLPQPAWHSSASIPEHCNVIAQIRPKVLPIQAFLLQAAQQAFHKVSLHAI